ncbi:hypothetical protein GCM10010123_44150 [Pilimelia anulata]|uniref:Uncharacterized protein n=1 Tax=Pilimelia anulata TaxID=53371 RepID=A0A8J3BHV3_9ACTN|nr:hypothetical protein [Pilimelia anulata]GGK09439.1 hypothetical protein GCM10010123_44150 [Pilimelia anulata]
MRYPHTTTPRRWGALTAAAALGAALLPAPARAAPAPCPARVAVPNVAIGAARKIVRATLAQTCGAVDAFWFVYGPGGYVGALDFVPARAGRTRTLVLTDAARPGGYRLLRNGAYAPAGAVAQANDAFAVRLAGRAALVAARGARGRVTVRGTVAGYSPRARGFAGRAGVRVVVEYRVAGAWRAAPATRTGAGGAIPAHAWTLPAGTAVRARTTATATHWGTTAATVAR